MTTEWVAGGTAEVGWGITANHGGGYSYRLCPAPGDDSVVTEECFQQNQLMFHGDTQWVEYGEGGRRVYFKANRTKEGTWPLGSQWTKNPIPPCNNPGGGYYEEEPLCVKSGAQFAPPAPGLLGYGLSIHSTVRDSYFVPGKPQFLFTIMDKVQH